MRRVPRQDNTADGQLLTADRTVTAQRPRLVWVDIAKASSILLVVLVHATHKHFAQLGSVAPSVIDGWVRVHEVLTPLRMPVFFVASGLLAASALQRPWPAVRRRRFAQLLYLYVIWFLVALGVFSLLGVGDFDNTGQPLGGPAAWLLRFVTVDTTMWYLVALAFFFLAARLLRAFPTWVVLTGAALMSTVAYMNVGGTISMPPKHFVFFLVGAYLPSAVLWFSRRRWPWLVAALAVFAAVAAVEQRDLHVFYGYRPVAGTAGVAVGLLLASVAARSSVVASLGHFLGQRTLPIFVMHVPLLAAVHTLATGPGADVWGRWLEHPAIAVAYPLLITPLVVGMALLLHRLLVRSGAWWLFAAPTVRARGTDQAAAGARAAL